MQKFRFKSATLLLAAGLASVASSSDQTDNDTSTLPSSDAMIATASQNIPKAMLQLKQSVSDNQNAADKETESEKQNLQKRTDSSDKSGTVATEKDSIAETNNTDTAPPDIKPNSEEKSDNITSSRQEGNSGANAVIDNAENRKKKKESAGSPVEPVPQPETNSQTADHQAKKPEGNTDPDKFPQQDIKTEPSNNEKQNSKLDADKAQSQGAKTEPVVSDKPDAKPDVAKDPDAKTEQVSSDKPDVKPGDAGDLKQDAKSDGDKDQKPDAHQETKPEDTKSQETWGDGRDRIEEGALSESDRCDISEDDLEIIAKIKDNYKAIKKGSPNNEELFYANMISGRAEIQMEGLRCPDNQYHTDLATAVMALKLTAISQKKDDLYTARYFANPSGKTWTVIFYKSEKPSYIILNFRPVSDCSYVDTYRSYPDFSNYTHSFAGRIGEGGISLEDLQTHLATRAEISDLSRYSIQTGHWFVFTDDKHILKAEDKGFNRKKQRFSEPLNQLTVTSSARNTIDSIVKNFDFNYNGTIVLTDRARNDSMLINDDRDGMFHYLDESGQETAAHLKLCYEDL
ncbi:MAG: hypothetical protein IJ523_00130 [Succinivibrionaceae bacterium]|nr:hypothetical protein [Succinivibrionaceae bacterium]